MEEINKIIEESKALIRGIENTEIAVTPISTPTSFRTSLLTFLEVQMNNVQNRQGLLDLVDAEIIRKLAFHELDVGELRQLRNDLMNASTNRLSAILEPFKNTNATPNSIMNPPREDEGGGKDIAKELTSGERQAIQKLYQLLYKEGEKEKNKIGDLPE
jgi:hypothetical protein